MNKTTREQTENGSDFTGLRRYTEADCAYIMRLFYETVHTINARDYSSEQLAVWAPEKPDAERWQKTLSSHYSLVYEVCGFIAGFGDMAEGGYLDRLYVHKDFQRRGIAASLTGALETFAQSRGEPRIITDASITARPFFEKRGYRVIKEQQVERQGVLLTNYAMEKIL